MRASSLLSGILSAKLQIVNSNIFLELSEYFHRGQTECEVKIILPRICVLATQTDSSLKCMVFLIKLSNILSTLLKDLFGFG